MCKDTAYNSLYIYLCLLRKYGTLVYIIFIPCSEIVRPILHIRYDCFRLFHFDGLDGQNLPVETSDLAELRSDGWINQVIIDLYLT